MKSLDQKIILIIPILLFISYSCDNEDPSLQTSLCVKGMFNRSYCDGFVIKILDQSNIGKTWKDMYGADTFVNSVVASIDTSYAKTIIKPEQFFTKDSVFYFQYVIGGYARKQYNLCEPAPFITIISLSSNPCQMRDK